MAQQQIAMRVTEEEKQELTQYCKERGMTISGLIRVALDQYFKGQEKQEDKE